MSSAILCLVSPMLRTTLCGRFAESFSKRIALEDVEEGHFLKLIRLACGNEITVEDDIGELVGLGKLADRLQMEAVKRMVEDAVLERLSDDNCVDIWCQSEGTGLERLQKEACKSLKDAFEELSKTRSFLDLSEDVMDWVLEEDVVGADEEKILDGLLRWMTEGREEMRGMGLLRKIRYGVMKEEYLRSRLMCIGESEDGDLVQLLREAMAKKGDEGAEREWDGVQRLCAKWNVARKLPTPLVNLPAGTILGADVLKEPSYVALDREGRIIVSDSDLDQIIVFNSDGSVAQRFGSYGTAPGQFKGPMGVAVDGQGRIVVADSGNHRIQVLNADGSVARCFGSEGTAVGQLKQPWDVAVDREGRIVVAEYGNDRIQVFNADGSVARHFGSEGDAVGQFTYPDGVAVDGAGRIVVADTGNQRVQVFNGDGSVALCFGSYGDGPGQFNIPFGVAVDREGRFIVADWGNHSVQVFNSDGNFAHVIGAEGDGVGQLKYPYGVVVDGAGRILVVEASFNGGNHRVQVF